MDTEKYIVLKDNICKNISKAIIGKNNIIELILISFICEGHILIEDFPGLGKTVTVRAFAKTLGLDSKRVQFTPDLMPSDITGINFYNQKTYEFELRKGPVFCNILLADEINRATPRTQSSLLEAMAENQVTIDGETYTLPQPFMVLATQNPVESYGTFPLPEAQLDRFFMKISMGYPTRDEEKQIFNLYNTSLSTYPLNDITPVVSQDMIKSAKDDLSKVEVSEDVQDYIMDVIEYTRDNDAITLGVSPRGSIALYKASQAHAMICGRDFVIPEDVKYMAPFILSHRIVTKGISKISGRDFIKSVLDDIQVPIDAR